MSQRLFTNTRKEAVVHVNSQNFETTWVRLVQVHARPNPRKGRNSLSLPLVKELLGNKLLLRESIFLRG